MSLRNLLLALGLAILFFAAFPQLDLRLEAQLYSSQAGFFLKNELPVLLLYHGVEWVTGLALLLSLLVLLGGKLTQHPLLIDQRRNAAFFLLAVVLGPGLVVNGLFKEHWGRARPAQVMEFGGTQAYTPPLQPANQCESNCSFSCGHASMGFVFLAFGFMFPRHRRAWFAFGILLGLAVGAGRMIQGRHFFSDVIFSGIFVSMSTLWLSYLFHQLRQPVSAVARLRAQLLRQKPQRSR